MPTTYQLISSQTVTVAAASVTFSSIPATYDDLEIQISARSTFVGFQADGLYMAFNGDTGTNYGTRVMRATGTSSTTTEFPTYGYLRVGYISSADSTANYFSTGVVYIPNYLASQQKPVQLFGAQDNNSTNALLENNSGIWTGTSAITSITLLSTNANLAVNSTFYLYGIKNS